jgi:hypothetical protein
VICLIDKRDDNGREWITCTMRAYTLAHDYVPLAVVDDCCYADFGTRRFFCHCTLGVPEGG